MSDSSHPFYIPLYLMAKPVGAACNLRCSYCYYLEKSELAGSRPGPTMSPEVLERFIKSYIEAQTGPAVQFMWHGGEAMMAGLDFYRRVVEMQNQYAGGRRIDNSIQTNGTLITDEWCRFLKENGWLVGVSIDGPKDVHDSFRTDASGCGSFDRVMEGIRLMQAHGVEWNALAVVNSLNVGRPEEFYDFFKFIGCRYLQFTPVVERLTALGRLASADDDDGLVTPQSVSPEAWGEFLCRVFDRWVRADVGRMFVQLFDATLANWLGEMPGLCTMGSLCGHAGVVELNGDVYSCDHFVFPQYRIGNIMTNSVAEMMTGPAQTEFGRRKTDGLCRRCHACEFLFACHGECPKNRFVRTRADDKPHNYLCEGYRRFFAHAAPYMDFMADEYRHRRSPANVMKLFR